MGEGPAARRTGGQSGSRDGVFGSGPSSKNQPVHRSGKGSLSGSPDIRVAGFEVGPYGAEGIRTPDPYAASVMLSQLSYCPGGGNGRIIAAALPTVKIGGSVWESNPPETGSTASYTVLKTGRASQARSTPVCA